MKKIFKQQFPWYVDIYEDEEHYKVHFKIDHASMRGNNGTFLAVSVGAASLSLWVNNLVPFIILEAIAIYLIYFKWKTSDCVTLFKTNKLMQIDFSNWDLGLYGIDENSKFIVENNYIVYRRGHNLSIREKNLEFGKNDPSDAKEINYISNKEKAEVIANALNAVLAKFQTNSLKQSEKVSEKIINPLD